MKINLKSYLKKQNKDWAKLARKNNVPKEIIQRVNTRAKQELKGV